MNTNVQEYEFGNIHKSIHYDQNPSSKCFLYHFKAHENEKKGTNDIKQHLKDKNITIHS